jgi:hypothetical protein
MTMKYTISLWTVVGYIYIIYGSYVYNQMYVVIGLLAVILGTLNSHWRTK